MYNRLNAYHTVVVKLLVIFDCDKDDYKSPHKIILSIIFNIIQNYIGKKINFFNTKYAFYYIFNL